MTKNMQRRIGMLVACASVLLSSSTLLAQDKYSAAEMQADCQAIINTAKASGDSEELEFENTFASGTCWGAFLSIQQIIVTKQEGKKNTILHVCVPEDTTLLQIIQVFDVFVRTNANRQEEPFTKVAIAALRSAFPCK